MSTIGKIATLLVTVYVARWIYLLRKSFIIELDEARLFEVENLGAVKEYAAHKRIETVAPGVHAAIDYALASTIFITRNNKWFIIDTTENCRIMKQILQDFEEKLGKPSKIEGIIMTHFHPDHTYGSGAVVNYAMELGQENVPIYAHDKFSNENEKYLHINRLGFRRAVGQFGQLIDLEKQINSGVGHRLMYDKTGIEICPVNPTHTISDQLDIPFGDITLRVFHAPGETEDQLAVYIPELKVLCPADNVYPHFPNLYPIRGAPVRNVRQWCDTVNKFAQLDATTMIGCHGPIVHGQAKIQDILQSYHDAMKYVHDQTVRHMELLEDLDDIVKAVKLPKQLADHPWLVQTYGKVEWCVRGVYGAYIGWFDGAARNLRPLHHAEHSKHIVKLAGGVKNVALDIHRTIEESTNCHEDLDCIHNNLQWALQLTDNLLAAKLPDDITVLDTLYMPRTMTYEEFIKTKIFILTELGNVQSNPTARNWYLNDAMIAQTGTLPKVNEAMRKQVAQDIKIDLIFGNLECRFNAQKALANWNRRCVLFELDNRQFYYLVRNGLFIPADQQGCGTVHHGIITSEVHFKEMLISPMSAAKNFVKGNYEIIGSTTDFLSFMSLFK